jgi:hypothetical protein
LARILANEKAETLGSDKTSEVFVFELVTIFSTGIEIVVSTTILGSEISIISTVLFIATLSGSVSTTVDLSVIE